LHDDPSSDHGQLAVDRVTDALRAARELLGMQIAWVAELRDDRKVFQIVEGDGASFGFAAGSEIPVDETYCARLIRGEIPQIIRDTSATPAVRDLEITGTAGIGSYVGIPIELGDGTIFGTLCCASHEAAGQISEQDLNFLRRISRRVASNLDDLRVEWARAVDAR
jgi:GAF domain-containing protein